MAVSKLTDLVRDVRAEVKRNNVSLVAAGVAFYGLLALFPALIATITLYGLVADPNHVKAQISAVTAAMPRGAADLLTTQLTGVASTGRGALTFGLVISLGATIWAASGGVRALLVGLNVIFDAPESRGLVRRYGLGLGLTVAALVAVPVALTLIAAFPFVLAKVGLSPIAADLAHLGRWVLLVALVLTGLTVLYRVGPSRPPPRRRWVTGGSVVALAVWAIASAGFSVYVSNFGSYNQTYGSIAAVIVLMLWLYLSALAVLVGAEVDAVRERDEDVTHTTAPAR